MKIAKLHKPQRISNLESVIAYSSEEDEENPDELADAEAAANADSISTPTDSTGVQITDRGAETTVRGDGGSRITFSINSPIWIDTADDSTAVDSLRISIPGAYGAGIDIAIPLNNSNSDSVYPPNYMGSGPVEYDQFGNPLYH